MATAIATYSITFTSGLNTDLYNGSTVNATLTRTSATVPPANAYVVSGHEELTNFWVYNGTLNRFKIGYTGGAVDYYGKSGGYEKNESGNQYALVAGDCYPNDVLLQVGNSGIPVVLTQEGPSSVRLMKLTSSSTYTWTVTYDVQATASDATYTNPVVAGNNMTINITNSAISTSTLSHRIDFAIGNYSDYVNLNVGVTSTTYIVPSGWVNAITGSDSGICTMTLSTYSSGTFVGSKSYSVTIQVPSSMKPTIGSVTTTRIDNSVPSGWGIYVQGKSGVTITANNCSGVNGSTITKYVISGGMSATQSTNSFTLNPIQSYGTITFTITITDSRGQTASQSVSIYVYAYSVPSITNTEAYKCTSNGTRSSSGRYLALKMTATYTTLGNNNSLALRAYYRVMGASTWTYATALTSGVTTIIGGSLDPEQNYEVEFVAADSLSTVQRVVDINSVAYTLHFKNGGLGMGIGRINTLDNALQINDGWTIYHGTNNGSALVVPSVIYSSTAPTGQAGVIWLKPVS